jgi:hypothetical protein
MIKRLGISIALVASVVSLYGMEMQDSMEMEGQKEEVKEIDYLKYVPSDIVKYIVSYVTGLRTENVSKNKKELEVGLAEVVKDIKSLRLVYKCFKDLIKSDKEGWFRKQHQCEICPKENLYKTAYYNALLLHKLQAHPFICNCCKKAFTEIHALKAHEWGHAGEKPYTCDQCDKAFTTSSSLNKHKRIHTGEKPHQCDQCEKSFPASTYLKTHKRKHTEE